MNAAVVQSSSATSAASAARRPILFSAPMVKAILAGAKTQTRRACGDRVAFFDGSLWTRKLRSHVWESGLCSWHCPYGRRGERLWVRETWATVPWSSGAEKHCPEQDHDEQGVRYRATWDRSHSGHWRPSIHMRRWASRISLEVTGVRVQRLQETSIEDARAEGIPQTSGEAYVLGLFDLTKEPGHEWDNRTSVENYARLWDRINGAGSWDANPWVWAVSFRRCS
jgi:hypothetical protein